MTGKWVSPSIQVCDHVLKRLAPYINISVTEKVPRGQISLENSGLNKAYQISPLRLSKSRDLACDTARAFCPFLWKFPLEHGLKTNFLFCSLNPSWSSLISGFNDSRLASFYSLDLCPNKIAQLLFKHVNFFSGVLS